MFKDTLLRVSGPQVTIWLKNRLETSKNVEDLSKNLIYLWLAAKGFYY